MNWLLFFLLFLSLVANGVLVWISVRLARRLLQFDDLFALLSDDIDVNARYLEKLTSTDLFENSPEVQAAHKNMKIVSQRMDEFVIRMEEITGRTLRKKGGRESSSNPPVLS